MQHCWMCNLMHKKASEALVVMSAIRKAKPAAAFTHQSLQPGDGTSRRISKIDFPAKKLRSGAIYPKDEVQKCLFEDSKNPSSSTREISACLEVIPHIAKRRKVAKSSLMKCSIEDVKCVDEEASASFVSCVISLFDPEHLAAATRHIRMVDKKLCAVIDMHEGPKFEKCESAFASLLRSIVYQQLATKAASAIHGRLVALCGGFTDVTPSTILKLSAMELRVIGISERKASYLHDLASNFTANALSDSTILLMDDSSLMKALTAVKGIGVWSVHMFMIFSLHRPDVLPTGDLGIRKGFQKLYNLKSLPDAEKMEELSSKWRPYRSLGSWYMWRVLSGTLPFTAIGIN